MAEKKQPACCRRKARAYAEWDKAYAERAKARAEWIKADAACPHKEA